MRRVPGKAQMRNRRHLLAGGFLGRLGAALGAVLIAWGLPAGDAGAAADKPPPVTYLELYLHPIDASVKGRKDTELITIYLRVAEPGHLATLCNQQPRIREAVAISFYRRGLVPKGKDGYDLAAAALQVKAAINAKIRRNLVTQAYVFGTNIDDLNLHGRPDLITAPIDCRSLRMRLSAPKAK